MERYWCLQWLAQNAVTELDAVTMKDGLARAEAVPLVIRAAGAAALPRGSRVRLRLGAVDLLTLDVQASIVACDATADGAAAAAGAAPASPTGNEAESDDDGSPFEGTGALSIALDMAEAEATEAADAGPAAEAGRADG